MSEAHEDLKVHKNRLAVEVALRDGEKRQVHLFLAEHEAHSFHQQRVSSLLEDSRHFLPAYAVDEDTFLFLSKEAIGWLSMSRTDELDGEMELFDEDHTVEVRLLDRTSLTGELMYSPPVGGARIVDHLNAEDRYFQLYDSERIYFIDKAFVDWVRETNTGDAE